MPSGSGGQISITRATSLYDVFTNADSKTWNWTNFVSETIEHTYGELEEGAITGYKDAPPSYQGIDTAKGDINLSPNPDMIGHYMRGVFGQSSSTILTGATSTGANSTAYGAGKQVNNHYFLPIQTADSDTNFLPPYNLMVYKDLGSAWVHQGVIFNQLEFGIQAGQLVKSKVSMMARTTTRMARTSSQSNLPAPLSKPWIWDMASVQVGPGVNSLAANTNFESITIAVNIPTEGVVLLDGTKKYAEFQVNEFRRVTINGTISFRNQLEYDAFVAYQSRFLRVTLTSNHSSTLMGNPSSAYNPTLQLNIPQFKILTFSVPISGPNRLQVQFTGKGERDPTSSFMIDATLINVTSAY
jgi:hypothetical protein